MPYKVQKKGDQHCVVKEGGAQVACHDTRSGALAQVRALYANEKADLAHEGVAAQVACIETDCSRAFLEFDQMVDHAEAVHTFSDIEELVRDAVRDKYNREGNYKVDPPIRSIYAWVRDTSADWVVFEMNRDDKGTLYKASYTITDGVVSLGEPVEVVRKTVYEPVQKNEV